MTALWAIALLLVADGGIEDGRRRFEAATTLESAGDHAGAASALVALASERPDDPYADDALFEAALIAEERLGDPERAARLYQTVATRYPSSRLARRARSRADFLTASLKTGAAPLKAYQAILGEHPKRPPHQSIARMEQLLREHPDFAIADRALYWLGSTCASENRDEGAMAPLLELERRFPKSEWAARAQKLRGDLLLKGGHPFLARRVFQELGTRDDLLSRSGAQEGLSAVRSRLRRTAGLFASLAYLVGFFALQARALRRRARWPTELWFYLPVAVLFVGAALSENAAIGWATFAIAVGGALVVFTLTARDLPRTHRGRLARISSAALAVIAVTYLAVHATGLTDLILETLLHGPER